MTKTAIIELGNKFNMSVDFSKLINLKEILIGNTFNSELILPDSVEKILFSQSSNFNIQIKNYPAKLTHLTFGFKYNQSIDNLPQLLKYLKFGSNFNQQINNLPNKLEYLFLDYYFNQNLDFLPETLKTLEFANTMEFKNSLDNLPINLSTLLLGHTHDGKIGKINLDNLPNNITCLRLRICNLINITKLPQKIKKLIIIGNDMYNFKNITNIKNYNNINQIEMAPVDINHIDIFLQSENIKTITIELPINSYTLNQMILSIKDKINKINNGFNINIIEKSGIKTCILNRN